MLIYIDWNYIEGKVMILFLVLIVAGLTYVFTRYFFPIKNSFSISWKLFYQLRSIIFSLLIAFALASYGTYGFDNKKFYENIFIWFLITYGPRLAASIIRMEEYSRKTDKEIKDIKELKKWEDEKTKNKDNF